MKQNGKHETGPSVLRSMRRDEKIAAAFAGIAPAAVKTSGERVAALRQRREDLGLKRLDLYAHPDDHKAIKALADKLQRKRARAKSVVGVICQE